MHETIIRHVTIRNRKHYTSDPEPTGSTVVSVEVDVTALAEELGHKARRSRGKKSVEAGGAIVVRFVRSVE